MVTLRSKKVTDSVEGESTSQEVHLITGGGGFAGFWLGKRLAGQGHKVILVDVREPVWTTKENMVFRKVRKLIQLCPYLTLPHCLR